MAVPKCANTDKPSSWLPKQFGRPPATFEPVGVGHRRGGQHLRIRPWPVAGGVMRVVARRHGVRDASCDRVADREVRRVLVGPAAVAVIGAEIADAHVRYVDLVGVLVARSIPQRIHESAPELSLARCRPSSRPDAATVSYCPQR
jgi:hypothetical protein